MNIRPLVADAVIGAAIAGVVLILVDGVAIGAIVAVVLLILCGVSLIIDRRRAPVPPRARRRLR